MNFNEDWLNEINDSDCKSSLLSLLSHWFKSGRGLSLTYHDKLLQSLKSDLKSGDRQIKIGALRVLGNSTHVLSASDRSLATSIMAIINRHTKNQGKYDS